MSRCITAGKAWCAATLALVALSACSRQHAGPELADTVTNWLAACERNSDCTGEAVCLNALCSLPCAKTSSSVCSAIDEGASCEVSQGMCDLSCQAATGCLQLGPEFSCLAGRCRVVSGEASGDSEPLSNDDGAGSSEDAAIPFDGGARASDGGRAGEGGARPGDSAVVTNAQLVESAEPTRPANWSTSAIADHGETSFTPGARIKLSDYAVELDAARASWQTDHWQVSWPVPAALMLGTAIGVASVFPDGRVATERRSVSSAPRMRKVYNGPAMVAHVGGEWQGPCSLAFSDLAGNSHSEPWLFDCNLMFAPRVARLAGSNDWIVTWTAKSAANPLEEDILVARYDPRYFGWRSGPWLIGGGPGNHTDSIGAATAEDGDLWIWGPSPITFVDGVYRVGGLASPEYPREPVVTRFDFITGWVHTLVPTTGGLHALETLQGSRTLRVTALDATGAVQSGNDLRELQDFPRDATYVPERALFALCTDTDGLRLRLFDRQGVPVGEPLLIDASDGIVYPSGCSLAWSGSEFLAVWTRTALGNGLPAPGFDSTVGTVHAKVVPMSELMR